MDGEKYKMILHKLGYYSYLDGLIRRHVRQEGKWDSHLANCRRFILEAVDNIRPQKITVLGSGWLLDLPLAELLEKDVDITLIDIFHPPDLRKQVSGRGNVSLVEDDITGGLIGEIWEKVRRVPFYKKLQTLNDITVPEYHPGKDAGMIISLNILSQLDVLPLRFLKSRSVLGEEEYNRLRVKIQSSHIKLLERYRSVVITDYEEVTTDARGRSKARPTVVAPLPEGGKREEWIWDFDLTGTDSIISKSVLRVAAICL